MNNMLEYMTGGQCYKCGGKVRYPDGGENMQEQQPMQQGSPVANVGMQQPQRQPSTIDANAKELMRFLLAQLQKGTSERILKKTLTDSGLKAEQADELLGIAKQEFNRTLEEGEYSTSAEEEQMQMMARQQQMAQQQMMGQAGPGAGMDPSMMAMNQQTDQSQTADSEMEARFGGSMRRLRRMNMGGTCADGLMWDDVSGRCVPTSTTANVMSAGAGPMNMGTAAPSTQQQLMQQSNIANQNTIANAKAQDSRTNAEMGYYDQIISGANANRKTQFDTRMTAMGDLHNAMQQGQLPWQKQTTPIGTNTQPELNQGTTQDQGVNTVARFGGLARFVNGGLKKYGPGGATTDGCPGGYYKDANGDCQKIFGSGQAQQEYQRQVVDFWNKNPSQDPNSNKAPMMSFEEWSNTAEGKAQDKMYNDMITSPDAYQKYVNDYSTANTGKTGAQPHMSYDDWKAQQLGQQNNNNANNNNSNNNASAPIDPRLTNSPYIVRTDKNKIANLDNNWVNRALAVGSNIGSAQSLGYAGAFGPYLKMLMGATGAISSAALGAKKIFAGDKRTVYDDKGNVFVYDNKRSFKRAGRDGQQGTNADGENIPNTGVNEDIPKGHFLQTNTDEYGRPVGIGRKGDVQTFEHPERGMMINTGRTDEFGQPIKEKYSDDRRLDENLFLSGKTEEDFKEQGPALFGDNMYGSREELANDYKNAGFFGKMRQRNRFKKDQLWNLPQDQEQLLRRTDPDAFMPDSSVGSDPSKISPVINTQGPIANDPNMQNKIDYMNSQLNVKEEGGEWNPFVDNRRKLRISMPMYNNGGRVDNESFPYTQAEWAQKKGKPLPLSAQDVADYDNYVKNFNVTTPTANTTSNTTPQTNTTNNVNMTNNANNALSNNPNANMVNTKKYTIGYGDELGSRVAQNLYSGLAGWEAGLNEIQGNKRIRDIQKKRQDIGNSMEIAAVNPINMYGSWQLNANQGSNYDLANQGATQDWQTTLNAKFGGSIYRRGGTYMVSPQELQAIIAMGGEVEFLD